MGHLGKTIDHDKHRVVATNNEKITVEIHGERCLRPVGNFERLKEAIWSMMSSLGVSICVARLEELFDQFPRLWPTRRFSQLQTDWPANHRDTCGAPWSDTAYPGHTKIISKQKVISKCKTT
jgi:hypothetical protein